MTQVRRPLIGVLALFTAAITLDRIGVGSGGQAIASYAYFIALIAIAVQLASPAMPRRDSPSRFAPCLACRAMPMPASLSRSARCLASPALPEPAAPRSTAPCPA